MQALGTALLGSNALLGRLEPDNAGERDAAATPVRGAHPRSVQVLY
jgi:hypothetical protein